MATAASLGEGAIGSEGRGEGQGEGRRRRYAPGAFELAVKRARAGLGLFAQTPIPEGACVIEYVGRLLTPEERQVTRSSYLFDLGRSLLLDGQPRWNRARYINHSCAPNCAATVWRRRVFIHALRDIAPGEELGYHYGPEYFDARIRGRCRCLACQPNDARPLSARRARGG